MSGREISLSGWLGAICLAFAAFVYLHNTGSQHAATNPDEYLYLQIARMTADTGQWLPLQSAETKHRNTKPPALFWQGMASTGFGAHWELWRLRLPNALFSIATAAMVFLLARRMGGTFAAGAVAALAYLAFLGVYRHGRVFLTSAPETFWLFLPFFLVLMRPRAPIGYGTAFFFGLIFGAGLLCKSFAMIIPSAFALAWWTLHLRGYRVGEWFGRDAAKIILISGVALATFSLWFVFDPQRHLILPDFVLKENVGKFDSSEAGYLATALWGKHSIWQYALGWLTNAGLVAPAVIAVFMLGWKNRNRMEPSEQLLWIWIISLFVFHLLPNLRYERYLLPAMPAVAVLCGVHWPQIPRWVQIVTLAACLVLGLALLAGAGLLTASAAGIPTYGTAEWIMLAVVPALALAAMLRKNWSRTLTLPAVLLVYFGFALFLRPFDGPSGAFPASVLESVRGRVVTVPSPFTARDEIYRFALPGAEVRRIKRQDLPAALENPQIELLIVPVELDGPENVPGFRVLGSRLMLNDYFTAEQTKDVLRGDVARHLFQRELLVERGTSAPL